MENKTQESIIENEAVEVIEETLDKPETSNLPEKTGSEKQLKRKAKKSQGAVGGKTANIIINIYDYCYSI